MTEVRNMNGAQQEAASVMSRLQQLSAVRARSRALTEDEVSELEDVEACAHCGGFHSRACPRVKRLEFHPQSGKVVVVEFWPAHEIDWTGVIFTDQADDGETWVDTSDFETLLSWAEKAGVEFKSDVGYAIRRLRLALEEQRAVQSPGEPA